MICLNWYFWSCVRRGRDGALNLIFSRNTKYCARCIQRITILPVYATDQLRTELQRNRWTEPRAVPIVRKLHGASRRLANLVPYVNTHAATFITVANLTLSIAEERRRAGGARASESSHSLYRECISARFSCSITLHCGCIGGADYIQRRAYSNFTRRGG